MALVRQSRPDSSLGFQVTDLKTFQSVSSFGGIISWSGWERTSLPTSLICALAFGAWGAGFKDYGLQGLGFSPGTWVVLWFGEAAGGGLADVRVGVWCLVSSVWCLMCGVWCLVLVVWCLMFDV